MDCCSYIATVLLSGPSLRQHGPYQRKKKDFVWKNIGFRASAISQKHISCETSSKTTSATPPPAPLAMLFTLQKASYSCKSQWNSIDNLSSSTTCNPNYIAGTILQLQITMEFCRPHMHEKQLKPHLQCGTDPSMIRDRSEHDPNMIRPHTRPSRNRRTAEVDHRGSWTDLYGKTQGFVHLLSLKNACRARLPPKLHRQLLHQHHLQCHLQ